MCGRLLLLLLVLVLVLAHGLAVDQLQAQVRHPLPVLWMMPVDSGSGSQNLTAGVGSAIRMALQDLKKQPAPLGNYEIQLHLVDSQCDPAKSLKALFDTMWEGPKYLLVFGGVCPSVTTIIARALPALNLVQVSFADTSPSLANRKWYRNLFSLMPSDRVVNQAAVKLLQRYQWARVGVVTQETPRLSQMKTDLLRQLMKTDVHAVSTQSLSNDVCSSLRRLKDHDVHIVIAHVEEDLVSELFCCVYRLNLFGPQYQWIVFDSGTAGWRLGWRASACELNSLAMAADGSIRLQITALANANTLGVSGRTPQNFLDSYLGQLVQEGSEVSSLHAFAYDSVWVAATALGHVMEAVKRRQKYGIQRNVTVSCEEEEEEEEEEQRMLLDAIKRTRFDGVTGEVRFRNGERMSTIELIQFQDSSGVLVGLFSTVTEQLHLHDHLLKFKGVTPATDHTLVRLQRLHVTVLLYCIVSSAAAVTVFITLLVLCFVIISGRLWLLGSSSRTQDVLLLLGLLLSSSSVVLSGLDGVSVSEWTFELLCSVRLWTLSVGHTVVFAVLLSKTWTLYFLHRVKQKQQQQQQSCRVLLWIFLLDTFVLTCWQILDPLRRVELQHRSQSDSADPGVLTQPFSEHCSSTNMELWLTAVCGYKGPLLGLGCFLAWNIRSVETNRPGISGRRLTPSVFAVAAFSASGATASLLTTHNPPLQFCVSSGLILSCNVFILTSMFAPTILNVWMNRGGDDDDDGGGGQQQDEAASEEGDKQSSRLNTQLKSRNAQLNVEIESVTTQLCKATEARTKNGEVRSVSWSDEARVSDDGNSRRKRSSPDDVNSPENVQRRLSVQLPILHRSYLPVIGGVSSSSSGLSDLELHYL